MTSKFYKIFILPSLQEIVKTGFDNENIPYRNNIIDKNDLLYYEKLTYNNSLHFIQGQNMCNQEIFWKQLISFINKISLKNVNSNFFLISHHNRMKQTIFDDMIDKNTNAGFANCCCIRIYNKNNQWNIKIVYSGFADETKYRYFKKGILTVKKFGIKNNLEDSIIYSFLEKIENKNTSINIIRHGNSLHNNPLNVNKKSIRNYFLRIYDSPLTILGIYQTRKLKKYLIEKGYLDIENDNIFCASTLNRAQHTSLILIPNIMRYKNLHSLKNYFNKNIILKSKEYYTIDESLKKLVNFHFEKTNKNIEEDLKNLLNDLN